MFVVLVVALLLWFPGRGPVGVSAAAAGDGWVPAGSSAVTISGNVSRPIGPGALVALDLRLGNSNDVDLAIDRITVVVARIDAPQADADHPCTAADFEVRPLADGVVLRLAGNSTDTLRGLNVPDGSLPGVGMLNRPVNQDGCKGASLTLNFEASGVEVPR